MKAEKNESESESKKKKSRARGQSSTEDDEGEELGDLQAGEVHLPPGLVAPRGLEVVVVHHHVHERIEQRRRVGLLHDGHRTMGGGNPVSTTQELKSAKERRAKWEGVRRQ